LAENLLLKVAGSRDIEAQVLAFFYSLLFVRCNTDRLLGCGVTCLQLQVAGSRGIEAQVLALKVVTWWAASSIANRSQLLRLGIHEALSEEAAMQKGDIDHDNADRLIIGNLVRRVIMWIPIPWDDTE
jgi:hypothetical protein